MLNAQVKLIWAKYDNNYIFYHGLLLWTIKSIPSKKNDLNLHY